MKYSWVYVGAKVQCIVAAQPPSKRGRPFPLIKGDIYTIARVEPHPKFSEGIAVWVQGVPRARFSPRCFKPLNKDDVELFEKLLNTAPDSEDIANESLERAFALI